MSVNYLRTFNNFKILMLILNSEIRISRLSESSIKTNNPVPENSVKVAK